LKKYFPEAVQRLKSPSPFEPQIRWMFFNNLLAGLVVRCGVEKMIRAGCYPDAADASKFSAAGGVIYIMRSTDNEAVLH
jgi:hypothetical protein